MDVGIASTITHSHSHSHAPRHPHAEPASPPPSARSLPISTTTETKLEKKEEEADEMETTEEIDPKKLNLPTRLDRLIAFLDSYFGQVELIIPSPGESTIIEVEVPTTILPLPVEIEGTVGEGTKLGGGTTVEGGGEVVVKFERKEVMKVPIIRVRLDENFADVTVEDLVRPLLPPY